MRLVNKQRYASYICTYTYTTHTHATHASHALLCPPPPHTQVVGKPTQSFFNLALSDLNIPPTHAVMIGDDVRDDVGGAQQWGIRGVLVKTGKYREGDEVAYGITPDATVEDFSAAVDWILSGGGGGAL